ncbi:uncharacterized protein LOC135671761 [Musa acuminata AAA Group]|uniref:uncharacterized protein LOC135671761 n=1 Tax=Musa acuminata AAA Group TaxID=214697 RepID=UPI0031DDAA39
MLRQASSRSQRNNKGLKVRNVLQICLLVAVCFWLLYQMKHTYDKKKASSEQNTRVLNDVVDSQSDFMDPGRKGLPHNKETVPGDKIHIKEEENEEVEEEEDGETQQAIEDEEAKGIGDDVIDEQDSEQGDEQDDQERPDEEVEDGEDKNDQVEDGEDKNDQVEEGEFIEDQEHEEGSSQEAHEKIYKSDDASSAVLQENQVTETEDKIDSKIDTMEEEQLRNNENDTETKDTIGRMDDGPMGNNDVNLTVLAAIGNETIQNNSLTVNKDTAEKTGEELSPNSQTKLQVNSTIARVSDNQLKLETDSPIAVSSNETEGQANIVHVENGAHSSRLVEDHNTTIALGSPKEDNSNVKSVVEEQLQKSNTTIGHNSVEELSNVSLATNENRGADEGDLAGSSHRMVTEEERDARTDLSTLPDIQNDIKNIEGDAAE